MTAWLKREPPAIMAQGDLGVGITDFASEKGRPRTSTPPPTHSNEKKKKQGEKGKAGIKLLNGISREKGRGVGRTRRKKKWKAKQMKVEVQRGKRKGRGCYLGPAGVE